MSGCLYVVGTPIGNLEDLSQRSSRILSQVKLVFAEDTRVSTKLLNHLGSRARLQRADEHTAHERIPALLEELASGSELALVSDAGMPGISDPGAVLVDAALAAGYRVEVVPGPSALVCALALSGFELSAFSFHGFAPRKERQRKEYLQRVSSLCGAHIFYESPHRICELLRSIAEVLPKRQVALCRELTKLHEEILRGSAAEILTQLEARDRVRGEFVLVIDALRSEDGKPLSLLDLRPSTVQSLSALPAEELEFDPADKPERWVELKLQEAARKQQRAPKKSQLAKELALVSGLSKDEAYNIVMTICAAAAPAHDNT